MASVISNGDLRSLGNPFPDAPPGFQIDYQYGPFGFAEIVPEAAPFDVAAIWASQPSVRKVVDFIARALASTPLKTYQRVSDTDRRRLTDSPIARILSQPRVGVIPYRFWHSVIVDALLYDRWCVAKTGTLDASRPLDLTRVQSVRTRFHDDNLGGVAYVLVDGKVRLNTAGCLLDHGYAPRSANGTSPMETLSAIIHESSEAVAYRRSVWKNGGRIPAVIERPAEAPEWSDGARDRFLAGWRAYTRSGGSEGGTPLLQDGMKLVKAEAFTPRDTNDIEGRQLNDAEVASAFHIAPELVGARQGNYSNVAAFREALYGDALGPYYEPFQQVINAMLVAELDDTGQVYVEYDIESKMRGSFETQAAVISTSVGRPWMTAAEARGRMNLPDLGGDTHDLVTPLNVLVGGQASPRDAGSQNLAPKAAQRLVKAQQSLAKARSLDSYRGKVESALVDFFDKQGSEVLAAMGRKAGANWWDSGMWDADLAAVLHPLAVTVAGQIGEKTAESLGFDPLDYDTDRTLAWLAKVADTRASSINATTLAQLQSALESDSDSDPETVFDIAKSSRAPSAAVSIITATAGFAVIEAARQLGGSKATKTWITGVHPRASHAAMDGETVGIDDTFSNGLAWPGDFGDPDEIAGCNCGCEVSVP